MKRVILAAAFIAAISGFAAAQSSSATHTSNKQATVKKGTTTVKTTGTKSTVLKQETSANAKADSTVRLTLPVQKVSDTTAMPAVKKGDEF